MILLIAATSLAFLPSVGSVGAIGVTDGFLVASGSFVDSVGFAETTGALVGSSETSGEAIGVPVVLSARTVTLP